MTQAALHAHHRFPWLVAIVLVATLTACGGQVCSGRVEIKTATLPVATVGVAYSATIEAELTEEPDDDFYDYAFTVTGAMPPGLQATQAPESRRLTIFGTPSAAGVYDFDVHVRVAYPSDVGYLFLDPICDRLSDRLFSLAVAG